MDNKLIEESLQDQNSFSSNEHGIKTITKDNNIQALKEYPLPQRYNKTKLVLLPVNKEKFYFYWDFPQEFLQSNMVLIDDISFHIVDQDHNLISVIGCENDFGEYFYKGEFKDLKAVKIIAVYKHGIQYKNLLESNTLKVMNTEIKFPKEDVWMNKQKGFTEIIRASMTHFTLGMSSKNYVDEIQSLKEFDKLSKESYSSYDLGGNK